MTIDHSAAHETHASDRAPRFARLLSMPLAIIPDGVHGSAVAAIMNRVLGGALQDGELDFLEGRTVCIHVPDIRLDFCLTLQRGRLVASSALFRPDLSITGTLHACLLLVARREDTDTLFFQRRLRMEGDTELGLEVKNFLDGLDVDALLLPGLLRNLAQKALPLYERTLG